MASVWLWLKDNYNGCKDAGVQWNDLWSLASQVDTALAACRSDGEMLTVLSTNYRVETALRHLGAYFYEQRTCDRRGAAQMPAFDAPGARAGCDIVPFLMVAAATILSEAEHQGSGCVEAEIRCRGNDSDAQAGKNNSKDDGKGKDVTGKGTKP